MAMIPPISSRTRLETSTGTLEPVVMPAIAEPFSGSLPDRVDGRRPCSIVSPADQMAQIRKGLTFDESNRTIYGTTFGGDFASGTVFKFTY
jgi:hypothetical protein